MKHFVSLFAVLLLAPFPIVFSHTILLTLMPFPADLIMGNGQFKLDKTFRASIQGTPGERLAPAINRFMKRLAGRTGIFFENPTFIATARSTPTNLVIGCERPGKPVPGEDESYTLLVGLEALSYNQSGKPLPADWLEPRRKHLEEAKKPRGQAMLVVIEPVARLAN
jgi:hypothetical protein